MPISMSDVGAGCWCRDFSAVDPRLNGRTPGYKASIINNNYGHLKSLDN